ncbi:MAG: IS1182 family transposase [Deltaproteobacteria bacterium]|nr:IS1182 family transposase [Deltaproteobacteria bacterium]
MAKAFRPWEVEQGWLLPPSVHELVPPQHPAHFVRELVRSQLDLGAVLAAYDEERGFPPYHPTMMVALLLYGYTQGLFSSRKLAKACEERIDFMAVTAMQKPDFRTIGKFRLRHLAALGDLFVQVLKLCQKAGLVRLGHVALDGTKVKANASKHKAMSYRKMREVETRLLEEVHEWFRRADAEDTAEDAAHGDRRGDELPEWVANKLERIERIREARTALEQEAQQEAALRKAASADEEDHDGDGDDRPTPPSRPKHHADGTPGEKSQRNFTDPESRILKTRDGYMQGYNAQAAVDAERQIIVATEVYAAQNDGPFLDEMLGQIRANTGRQTRELSADYSYLSEANLIACARRHVTPYIATGRLRHHDGQPTTPRDRPDDSRAAAMAQKLRRAGRRSRYRLRKQLVEPVFGQIKAAMGFAGFLLRGLRKVRQEWRLVAAAHNLRKLVAAAVA